VESAISAAWLPDRRPRPDAVRPSAVCWRLGGFLDRPLRSPRLPLAAPAPGRRATCRTSSR